MRNGIFLLEFFQLVAWGDLAELVIFLKQFANLVFIGLLINLVSAVKLFHIVHHPKDAVDLFFVLDSGLLRAAEMNGFVH